MARRKTYELWALPLRDVVIYPGLVLPILIGRKTSIQTLERVMKDAEPIFLVAQKSAEMDDPKNEDLYPVGTVAKIVQLLKLPDDTTKALVEGLERAEIKTMEQQEGLRRVKVAVIKDKGEDAERSEAYHRAIIEDIEEYAALSRKIPKEIIDQLKEIPELGKLADYVAAHMQLKLAQKEAILEAQDVIERSLLLLGYIEGEMELTQVEKRIRGRVKKQMEKSQREYYLSEQAKAIQKELGEADEKEELAHIEERIKKAGMSKEGREKALSELRKLKLMPPMSAEATVVRNYIDVLLDMPWKRKSRVHADVKEAQAVLDRDHYGLEKVKERILEYLAVQKRVGKIKGPILCLVGPPGVGKTSLGQSIANATGRKYVRMALGGMHDESEIRGHRRTYIGSMPGKIIQNMIKAGVKNPLFLLDEVDKIGQDFRGDPASALLEVLDPEQNKSFVDHYAEVEFDLSDVMFIATSNSLNIPSALLDRMEVIFLSGYTEDEKLNIAEQYLVPKEMKNNGVNPGELNIRPDAIRNIIRYYTREAGVRSLQRDIAKICRKVVMQGDMKEKSAGKGKKSTQEVVDAKNLHRYLGVERYDYGKAESENRVGQVTGLAWTQVGGELLTIEAVSLPGKGNIVRTGKLGDVMQESIAAALSVVRFRSESLGVPLDYYEKHDIHIHVPEGATPKDGPSAGGAIALAIVSAITGVAVKSNVAMTGEITLRGEILPIGGLKEKLLAALRGGIDTVLIPKKNVKDLEEIPDNVKKGLNIVPVQWIDEILEKALEKDPATLRQNKNSGSRKTGPQTGEKNKNQHAMS